MRPIQFVPFYLLWIVSSALSVLDWFLLRSALTAVASAIANAIPMEVQIRRQWYARWVVRAVDPCATAVLSVLLLVSIILFDYLYRAAIAKGTIKKRFGLVTGIQAGILIVSAIAVAISSAMV
jgi:hypothetical protein